MTVLASNPVVIPPELLQSMGQVEQEMKVELAVFFYTRFQLSLGEASTFAGLTKVAFQRELGKRQVPIHYDLSDALHDIAVVEELNAKFDAD